MWFKDRKESSYNTHDSRNQQTHSTIIPYLNMFKYLMVSVLKIYVALINILLYIYMWFNYLTWLRGAIRFTALSPSSLHLYFVSTCSTIYMDDSKVPGPLHQQKCSKIYKPLCDLQTTSEQDKRTIQKIKIKNKEKNWRVATNTREEKY